MTESTLKKESRRSPDSKQLHSLHTMMLRSIRVGHNENVKKYAIAFHALKKSMLEKQMAEADAKLHKILSEY